MRIDPSFVAQSLKGPSKINPLAQASQAAPQANGSLTQTFESMLQEVNQQQLAADAKKQEFLTSSEKDLHGTMIAMEKAEVSLRLMLQVRNKLTAAYEEVMRMQV